MNITNRVGQVISKNRALGALVAVVAALAPVSYAAADGYLTLNSFSGMPGTTLIASGGGWTVGDIVNIFLNNTTAGTPAASATVGADNTFSTSVIVPANAPQGAFAITGVDATTRFSASNSFYVVPLTPSMTFTAASHAPFAVVSVSGSGFAPNETINIDLAGSKTSVVANSAGGFTNAQVTVPSVATGLYNVQVIGASSGASIPNYLNFFWIDAFYPSTSPSSYYLLPGSILSFNGSGFAPNETIKVTETNSTVVLSTFTADPTGSFGAAGGFALPASFHGQTKNFTLTGSNSKATASTGMTVGDFYAYASPSSYYLTPGASLSFSGGGFAAGETVQVYQGTNTTAVTSFVTGIDGTFVTAGSVAIPFSASNSTISYTLVGQSSRASASVSTGVGSFYPSISPSEYYVTPNSTITISGSGFAPNEMVSVAISGGTTLSATTSSLGKLSASIIVPFNKSGSATVTATGAMSHAVATVGVTMASFYGSVSPSAYYLFPGDMVSFMGSGFAPNEIVTIASNYIPSMTITANSLGNFKTASSTVPFNAMNFINTTFTGSLSGASAVSQISIGTLSPYLSSDLYSAVQGSTVHISGSSFGSGEPVVVTAPGFSQTVTANADGTVSPVVIPAPYGASTMHVVFNGSSTGSTASIDISLNGFTANLSADNFYAQPGTTIAVSGSGFAPSETVTVSNGSATTTVRASALGSFTTNVVLPFSGLSQNTIKASGVVSHARASVTIAYAPFNPAVSPSTYYTPAGIPVTFTGSGFAPNEVVSATFNGNAIPSVTASPLGAFTYLYTPGFSSTNAAFTFKGATTNKISNVSITIAPFSVSIVLSNYYAQGGSALTISGSGFAPNETVNFLAGVNNFAHVTASATGAFSYVGTVPFAPAGNIAITAVGAQSGATSRATITIAPVYTSIGLASYAGAPGSAITFIGSGYLPNEPITIVTDRSGATPAFTFNADATGSFSNAGYIVPATWTGGSLKLTITGTHSFDTKTINYYVTGM